MDLSELRNELVDSPAVKKYFEDFMSERHYCHVTGCTEDSDWLYEDVSNIVIRFYGEVGDSNKYYCMYGYISNRNKIMVVSGHTRAYYGDCGYDLDVECHECIDDFLEIISKEKGCNVKNIVDYVRECIYYYSEQIHDAYVNDFLRPINIKSARSSLLV